MFDECPILRANLIASFLENEQGTDSTLGKFKLTA